MSHRHADQLAVAIRSPVAAEEQEHDGGAPMVAERPRHPALIDEGEVWSSHEANLVRRSRAVGVPVDPPDVVTVVVGAVIGELGRGAAAGRAPRARGGAREAAADEEAQPLEALEEGRIEEGAHSLFLIR